MYQKNETGNRFFSMIAADTLEVETWLADAKMHRMHHFPPDAGPLCFRFAPRYCTSIMGQACSKQPAVKIGQDVGFPHFFHKKKIYSNGLSLYIIKALYHQTYKYEILIPYLTIISTYFMLNYNRFVNFISIVIIEVTTCMDLPMIIR